MSLTDPTVHALQSWDDDETSYNDDASATMSLVGDDPEDNVGTDDNIGYGDSTTRRPGSNRSNRCLDRYSSQYDSHSDDSDDEADDDSDDSDEDDEDDEDEGGDEIYYADFEDSSEQSCSGTSCCHPWSMEEINTNLMANEPDFTRLELDDGIDDMDSLIVAIRANKTVREVEVHMEALEGLSYRDQARLAQALCRLPELQSLLVYKNSLNFVEPLLAHRPTRLTNLRLFKLDISKTENIHLLVSALEQLSTLKTLDVGFDNTDSNGVLDALSHMKSIYVALECFRIDYKLLPQQYDDTTTDTDTDNNNNNNNIKYGGYHLDDRIVIAIAEVVQESQTLKAISFPPFSCTDKCYDALTHMLEKNYVLERIDYWIRVCNSLYYPDSNERIDYLLQLNQSGVRRLLQQPDGMTRSQVWQLLDKYRDDLDTVYHLFSSDPSLLPAGM